MPRSERQVPNVHFGRPGNLVTLPWPRGDMDRSYERLTSDFVTGSGQHQVSALSLGSRLYTLNWNALHVDTYARLEQYYLGQMGPGPWGFVDPAVPNMLLPNQSGATSVLNDARQWKFTATDQGTPSSNLDPTHIHRVGAPRSLRWQFTVAPGLFPTLRPTTPYRSWLGFAAAQSVPYTFSVWVKPDGLVDSSISVECRIRWLSEGGGLLSEVSSGFNTVTGWTKLTATGTSNAATVYAEPVVTCNHSTITTGASLYVDEPMLEQDSVANIWAGGSGARPVEILSLTERGTFDARWRQSVSMVLREVTA